MIQEKEDDALLATFAGDALALAALAPCSDITIITSFCRCAIYVISRENLAIALGGRAVEYHDASI